MLQDNKAENHVGHLNLTSDPHVPSIERRRIAENCLKGIERRRRIDQSTTHSPVYQIELNIFRDASRHYGPLTIRIKWSRRRGCRPDDGHHPHSETDRPHAVICMTLHVVSPLATSARSVNRSSPMSPNGGRIVVGVTPSTSWMALRVQPSSATICSFVRDVSG